MSERRAIAAQASTSPALSGGPPGPLPRQLRSMSGQRMLQRIHAGGELYLARGGRVSCGGRAGRGLDQVKASGSGIRTLSRQAPAGQIGGSCVT